MPAPSFTGALVPILCGSRLTFDLVSVNYKPERVEPALWSAYRFAEVLQDVTEEATCPAPPLAGEERASVKSPSSDNVVVSLGCVVGLLYGSCICLCIFLRHQHPYEISPYTPLVSDSDDVGARRARTAADEGW